MSSTTSETCVEGCTPPISPEPVSRPALLTASRSTSPAPGRCATYALSAATTPNSSLIFSAVSASVSMNRLRSLTCVQTNLLSRPSMLLRHTPELSDKPQLRHLLLQRHGH